MDRNELVLVPGAHLSVVHIFFSSAHKGNGIHRITGAHAFRLTVFTLLLLLMLFKDYFSADKGNDLDGIKGF